MVFMVMFFFAPVENPGKPLFERVRIVNKRKTLIITLMVIIISLSIRIKLPDASFAILVVLIEVALLIIWGKELPVYFKE
jgi:accessory gene regulator protein AgrB